MRYRRLRVEGGVYFFTVVTHNRNPLFANPLAAELFLDSARQVQRRHPFELLAYVILPDHLHTLWELPDGDAQYSSRWRLIKERFTREYCKITGGRTPVWQKRFWEHLVRDEHDYVAHLDYIHLNPVHHGYADAPRAWPHSSFGDWVAQGAYEEWWGADTMPALPEWAQRHE